MEAKEFTINFEKRKIIGRCQRRQKISLSN
jgi:hypothetical protein